MAEGASSSISTCIDNYLLLYCSLTISKISKLALSNKLDNNNWYQYRMFVILVSVISIKLCDNISYITYITDTNVCAIL